MDLDQTEIVVSEDVKLRRPEDMFAMLNKFCIRNLFGQDITHVMLTGKPVSLDDMCGDSLTDNVE